MMETEDGDRLEEGLLTNEDEQVLYSGSFEDSEDGLIGLKTCEWILYSLLLILAWGFGFLMLLYLPLHRYLLRRTIRSQRLYLTPNSIVYTVTKPAAAVPFQCFGALKKQKHVLLHSISDVIIQQGYLQSRYGVYSVKIQNATHTIIQIQGIANPTHFRNAVLTRLSNITNQTFHQDGASSTRSLQAPLSPLKTPMHDTRSHIGDFAVLQKLDQVANSLKVKASSQSQRLELCDRGQGNNDFTHFSILHPVNRWACYQLKDMDKELLFVVNEDCRIAGEIKNFSTDGWVAPKLSKRMDRFMLYMLTAGKKALADAGIDQHQMDQLDKTKCGVLIGSAMGGMKGWMGPNYSISTACATSNFCILNAANHIIRGEARTLQDMMLCGGSDAVIIPIGLGGFVACRALSERNSDPAKASRPWDSGRDGFVMGEGAGVLLLEELEHAKKRGATIYAEFLGGSFTSDAYHMTEPHPQGGCITSAGVILCIEKALSQSGVAREDVNYINAHATSTPAGDLKEYNALLHCFGQNQELKVNSTKSMIGHLLGAAGAVEAVATVQAIRTGWVHPNINLENPDEGVDTKVLVGPKKEKLDVKVALSNSFGFGGHNSSILFAPFQ
ncbi:keto acyl-acyl carrier protein synthase II [Artemisia annua]|uniref:beta-ketoacyl-[acyl-carrier-protein] synthase I n=1 Tax=Artemisia annua TaxID=35608 RepID=A0A2U1KPF3_ARTAN|nr:keto acyl-acyl carrier protein synthase II [Artemisia annua]